MNENIRDNNNLFRPKYCREISLKILYQVDVLNIYDKDPAELLLANFEFFKNMNEREKFFVNQLLRHFLDNKEEIDKAISDNLISWKLERLLPIDRCLLRLGMCEANFNHRKAVVIDDLIRIARKYGSEESYKMVNAVLDKIIP